MKKLFTFVSILALTLVSVASVYQPKASAAFNANRLIDDSIFNDSTSMNATQIDVFLNSFGSGSCISPNSGFLARIPSGYTPSGGFTYGGFVTAGQVIATSAQVYGVTPKALIVTLQKEQSLVNGGAGYCNNGDEHKYAAAVGYGCPDGGTVYSWSGVSLYMRNGVERTSTGSTCVNSAAKAGFSQQVIRAAWLLKFGQQRSLGNVNWAVITGSWDNSDDPASCYGGPMTQGTFKRCQSGTAAFYDGYTTIDGSATHMDSGATAALYWYTPHFHGNQNFVDLYTSWFGSPNSPCGSVGNVSGAKNGSVITAYNYNNGGVGNTALILPNNTGSGCVETHGLSAPGGQSWFNHVATGMRAVDPTKGMFLNNKAVVDRQNALNYVLYNGGSGKVEIHRMSPDFSRFPGYYDVITNLDSVNPAAGTFVSGDFFGRGDDQMAYILYSGNSGKVEIHVMDPSMQKAVGYYDVITNLEPITASTGSFVAGDFLGLGRDQLAYIKYAGSSGHVEVHLFDPSLQRVSGYRDVITNLTSVNPATGGFTAGRFFGNGRDQLALILYSGGGSGYVEMHLFDPNLEKGVGYYDTPTAVPSLDPTL